MSENNSLDVIILRFSGIIIMMSEQNRKSENKFESKCNLQSYDLKVPTKKPTNKH